MHWMKNKNTYHNLLVIGIILLPILELYRTFFRDRIQIIGFAADELIVMLWSGILLSAALAFSYFEKRKRSLTVAVIYFAVFTVYAILHAFNASKFNPDLVVGANPGIVREFYYTFRMYFFPTSLILSAALLKPPFSKIAFSLRCAAGIIAALIVIPDLFGFSFASYRDGNILVDGGFFSWFTLTEDHDFSHYAAKGLFTYANDMGAILFGLTPFVAYAALTKGRIRDYALLVLVGLASVMVGTKIGSYGFFLCSGSMVFAKILELVIRKRNDKRWIPMLSVCLILVLLFPLLLISPGYRLQSLRDWQREHIDRPTDDLEEIEKEVFDFSKPEDVQKLKAYIDENYWDHFINEWFLELYPVENDPEFWYEIIDRENNLNSDNRRFKAEMISRIVQKNNRGADLFLGIGYTSGVPYGERDYVFQYFLFGIGGLLVLILPFLLLFLFHAKEFLCRLGKRTYLLKNAASCLSLFAFLVTAYFSGHVFDTLLPTYFFAICCTALAFRKDLPEDESLPL